MLNVPFTQFRKVKEIFIPIMVADEFAQADAKLVKEWKDQVSCRRLSFLNRLKQLGTALEATRDVDQVSLYFGAILLVCALILVFAIIFGKKTVSEVQVSERAPLLQ